MSQLNHSFLGDLRGKCYLPVTSAQLQFTEVCKALGYKEVQTGGRMLAATAPQLPLLFEH